VSDVAAHQLRVEIHKLLVTFVKVHTLSLGHRNRGDFVVGRPREHGVLSARVDHLRRRHLVGVSTKFARAERLDGIWDQKKEKKKEEKRRKIRKKRPQMEMCLHEELEVTKTKTKQKTGNKVTVRPLAARRVKVMVAKFMNPLKFLVVAVPSRRRCVPVPCSVS